MKPLKNLAFLNCNVAGFSYHDGTEVFDSLKIGVKLQMIREKDNPYDHNAIALYYDDIHIGYIPRSSNELLANFFDLGYGDIFSATINRVDPQAHTENQVSIIVRILANTSQKKR